MRPPCRGLSDRLPGITPVHKKKRITPMDFTRCGPALLLAVLLLPGAALDLPGQAGFTSAQAEAGEEIYEQLCAACHLPSLQGSFEAPQLAGPNFRLTWGGRSVAELREALERMPPGATAPLDDDEYSALAAFLLSQNGVSAGAVALSFASPGPLFPGAGGQTTASLPPGVEPIVPAPGRAGNVPVPEGVTRTPETVGEIDVTDVGRTETFRRADRFTPVSDAVLANPPPGDWLHWRQNPEAWGHSPLTQIDPENVDQLQLAWVWGMEDGTSQPDPIVRDGVMFVPNAHNVIQALDATDGTLLWEWRHTFPEGAGGRGQLRNLGIWEDMIYVAAESGVMIALDARTGVVRWQTTFTDWQLGYQNSSGPIVVDGKLINGIDGCTRFIVESCFITAHDARTGEELWRTYTIARPGEPGGDTWGDLPFELRGGGEVWIAGSYDPELDLLFFGTAQSKPWVAASRGLTVNDSTLFANSTLAMDPDDGSIVWYFQHVTGETLDLDVAFERVLVDVEGIPVVFTIGKDGILWKLDRRTGEYLGLTETVYQDVYSIDYETGELTYRTDLQNAAIGEWLWSLPLDRRGTQLARDVLRRPERSPGHPAGAELHEHAGPRDRAGGGVRRDWGEPGLLRDARHGREHRQAGCLRCRDPGRGLASVGAVSRAPFTTSVFTTASGLAFAGDFDRWFHAYDVRTGEELWRTRLATSVLGYPITYEVDGVQYIAVPAGRGGGSPWNVPNLLTTEVRTPPGERHSAMYVFRLGAP